MMSNVYLVQVDSVGYYVEASNFSTAANRGLKAINRGRRDRKWRSLDHFNSIEVKITLEAKGVGLIQYLEERETPSLTT